MRHSARAQWRSLSHQEFTGELLTQSIARAHKYQLLVRGAFIAARQPVGSGTALPRNDYIHG